MILKEHHGALKLHRNFKVTRVLFKHVNDFVWNRQGILHGPQGYTGWQISAQRKNEQGAFQKQLSSLDDLRHSLDKHPVGVLWWQFKPCMCARMQHLRTQVPNWGQFQRCLALLVSKSWGSWGSWNLVGKARDAAKQTTRHRTANTHNKGLSGLKCQWCWSCERRGGEFTW